jgi:hypothetical protein
MQNIIATFTQSNNKTTNNVSKFYIIQATEGA